MEITPNTIAEASNHNDANTKNNTFDADKRQSIADAEKTDKYEKFEQFNPDKRVEVKPNEDGFYTTEKERIDQTPTVDSPRGVWLGERGNSKFIPTYEYMVKTLEKYGVDGIEYKNGVPDFSKVAIETETIDSMTEQRTGKGGNYEQFFSKLAEKYNNEHKDGRTDWDARKVKDYISENKNTSHECSDCKTMMLIETKIHDYFNHLGGCSECKHRDGKPVGGVFDE